MASLKQSIDRLPFAPVVAAMFAAVAAVLVLAMPHWLFEYYVQRLGIPTFLPQAAPPLGATAEVLAAAAAFLLTAAVLWPLLAALEQRLFPRSPADATKPMVTATPPAPLSAESELGAPLMSDEAMTQAREELMLDTSMIEAIEPEIVAVAAEPVAGAGILEVEAEIVEAVEPVMEEPAEMPPPPPVAPISRLPVATESLSGLIDRLDAALLDKPIGWKPQAARIAGR